MGATRHDWLVPCGLPADETAGVERQRQEVGKCDLEGRGAADGKDEGQRRRELPQHLTAGAARRGGRRAGCDDGQPPEPTMAGGDGREERNAFGAHAEAVARVLDIAARDDVAVPRLEGRTP